MHIFQNLQLGCDILVIAYRNEELNVIGWVTQASKTYNYAHEICKLI